MPGSAAFFSNCTNFSIEDGVFNEIHGNLNQYISDTRSATTGSHNSSARRGASNRGTLLVSFKCFGLDADSEQVNTLFLEGDAARFIHRRCEVARSQSQSSAFPVSHLFDGNPNGQWSQRDTGMRALPDPRTYQPDELTAQFGRSQSQAPRVPAPSRDWSYPVPAQRNVNAAGFASGAPSSQPMPRPMARPIHRSRSATQEDMLSSSPEDEGAPTWLQRRPLLGLSKALPLLRRHHPSDSPGAATLLEASRSIPVLSETRPLLGPSKDLPLRRRRPQSDSPGAATLADSLHVLKKLWTPARTRTRRTSCARNNPLAGALCATRKVLVVYG
ncbi:hypothetical protein GGX14DRAFT_697852, partial [Mycena pura]